MYKQVFFQTADTKIFRDTPLLGILENQWTLRKLKIPQLLQKKYSLLYVASAQKYFLEKQIPKDGIH